MAARYMAEAGNIADLAGVMMFDGVGTLSPMTEDLEGIPKSIPVYNLAGQPSSWNWYGDTNRRLAAVRPGMFTGITMKGGQHGDAMQTSSMLMQYATYLALGFSSPIDVLANRVLATGWINDMFDGTRTDGLYSGVGSPSGILTGWWWKQTGARTHTVTV